MTGFGRQQGSTAKTYPLNADQLKGKNKITVKFHAPADARGGSVYGVRILKVATGATAEK
jgi:hypothetical protein